MLFTTKQRGFLLILICDTSQIFIWRTSYYDGKGKSEGKTKGKGKIEKGKGDYNKGKGKDQFGKDGRGKGQGGYQWSQSWNQNSNYVNYNSWNGGRVRQVEETQPAPNQVSNPASSSVTSAASGGAENQIHQQGKTVRLITEPNALVFDFTSSHERGGENVVRAISCGHCSCLAATALDENQEVCSVER